MFWPSCKASKPAADPKADTVKVDLSAFAPPKQEEKSGMVMLGQMWEAAKDIIAPATGAGGGIKEQLAQLVEISLEYPYKDLVAATGNFDAEHRLGAGGAGAVYKGVLRGGTEVAIKSMMDMGGFEGFEEEVRVLSRFRHPNVVTLLGFGQNKEKKEKYLVYELLECGDVSGRLQKSRSGTSEFTWQQRVKVALDSAKGLQHMMDSTPKTLHRDIKTPNILLEKDGTAKLADFGLSGIVPSGKTHIKIEHIGGTPGYCCPTYMQTGMVSEYSEVYSFGHVLLELLVNKPPAVKGQAGELIYPVLQAVKPLCPGAHGRLLQHLDPMANWAPAVANEFADLALCCIDTVPERRPVFEEIVRTLYRLSNSQSSPIGVDPARPLGPPARPPAARPTGPCASGGSGGRPGGASMPLPPPPPQMGGVMFPQPAAPAAANAGFWGNGFGWR
mmetsp:Transcript_1494/g.4089  ORF Transcript_1494/g.4089 Transcript_1494/m.4089 type:complete len:444 (-) Transcript_1494:333-1664(-)